MADFRGLVLLTAVGLCAAGAPAHAQGVPRHLDLGAGFSGLGLQTNAPGETVSPGAGVVLRFWPHDRVALESEVNWFPRPEVRRYRSQGGQSLHIAAGARANFIDRPRWSIYGRLLPGLLRFSETAVAEEFRLEATPSGTIEVFGTAIGPALAFALVYGAGLEFRLSPQWAAQVSANTILFGFSPSTACAPFDPNTRTQVCFTSPGDVVETSLITTAVTYSFGQPRRLAQAGRVGGRWEVGAQFASQTFASPFYEDLRREPGIAVFGSYALSRSFDVDASVVLLPLVGAPAVDAGGRIVQGLAGIKFGIREGRVGAFAKLRGGLQRHSRTIRGVDWRILPPEFQFSASTAGVVDVGGVLSLQLGPRLVVRIDGGDLVVPAREVPYTEDGVPLRLPLDPKHTLSLAIGLGWRY